MLSEWSELSLLLQKMEIAPFAVLPPTICVLDDDPSMLRAIDRLLLSSGLEAQLFSDPLGFIAYAKCHSVAVAVIDIWMPGVSGLQVKKELQAIFAQNATWRETRRCRAGQAPYSLSHLRTTSSSPPLYQAMASAT